MSRQYYIQNVRNGGSCAIWWRPNGHGYTSNLDEAWVVTEQEAHRICSNRPEEDVPCEKEKVDAAAARHLRLP